MQLYETDRPENDYDELKPVSIFFIIESILREGLIMFFFCKLHRFQEENRQIMVSYNFFHYLDSFDSPQTTSTRDIIHYSA